VSDRIDSIRQLLESEPDDAFLRYSLGYELAKLGREDEAIEWFDRALEVDPDQHYAAFQKARALDALDRSEEGVAVARAQATRAQAAGDAKAAGELLGLADELEP
jgi:tetratricopeptide (TPR) repeat protein